MNENYWLQVKKIIHKTSERIRLKYSYKAGSNCQPDIIVSAISSIDGVVSCRVNSLIGSIIVYFDKEIINADEVIKIIEELKEPMEYKALTEQKSTSDLAAKGRLLRSFSVLFLSFLLPPGINGLLTMLAAIPLLKGAINELKENRSLNSHVLEALAVGISLYRRDYTAANTTTFMLSLGEYIENSISRRSDEMLKHMLHPVSDKIWVEKDGQEILLPSEDVKVGDIVIVGTGIVVPVDGTVLDGLASVNEAAMTGESVPVQKEKGDQVLSGTHIEEGRLKVYAEHIGKSTVASRIAEYVKHSLEEKSNVQLEASKLADRLVPGVISMAGVSYLISRNSDRVAAVLQTDFSCALKLATPVAFKSAMYIAGKNNMLIKGATALEKLAEADTFVFDKTGTLTEGRLEVSDSIVFDPNMTPEDLILLAASVEEHYFHPLAMAVVSAAKNLSEKHFDHNEVEFIVSHGVVSEIDGKRIVVGSRHFLEEHEGISTEEHSTVIENLYREGKILLYIGFGHSLVGILALKDKVRENAGETIARLKEIGVKKVIILTGDHREKAREISEQLSIDEFYSELTPEDKTDIIKDLTSKGANVAFIGDGINDAAALAGAQVGIAMEKGADIARISADIALMKDDISVIVDAKELANNTKKLINSNYRRTIAFNSGILGAAVFGLIKPVTASILHNGSTIAILIRAMNKLKFRKKKKF